MAACILSIYTIIGEGIKFYILHRTFCSTWYDTDNIMWNPFFFKISRKCVEITIIEMIISLCIKHYAIALRYSMY